MKIKHSKYKNPGILFELLVRQITADTLKGDDSPAIDILKKFFVKTELGREYKLYETILKSKVLNESRANVFITTALDASKKLNKGQLRNQKYQLIREIKDNYKVEEFFSSKIKNYKELMKGELPELTFQNKKMNSGYSILKELNPKISLEGLDVESVSKVNPKFHKLMWYLRYYDRSKEFILKLERYEKTLFMTNESDREYVFFQYILDNLLINYEKDTLICYKQNKVSDKKIKDLFYEIGNIYKDIINSLHPMTYKIIVETSHKIFTRIKGILN